MTVLHLPSADLLRVALEAGAVPPAVARRPVAARIDRGVWVQPAGEAAAEVRAGLARLGATAHHPTDAPPLSPVPCWAALLPLEPSGTPADGPFLLASPIRRRGLRQPRLADDGRLWAVADRCRPDDEAYTPVGPSAWVRVGWRHPLPHLLATPVGTHLVLSPDGWSLVPPAGHPHADRFDLPPSPVPAAATPSARLHLRLVATGRGQPAALWVRPGRPAAAAAALLGELGPDALDRFEAMAAGGLTLLRATVPGPTTADIGTAFAATTRDIYTPCGRAAVPAHPSLAPPVGHIRWFADEGGVTMHTAPAAFRPLAEWLVMTATPAARLKPRPARSPLDPPAVRTPPATAAPADPPTPQIPPARLRPAVEKPRRLAERLWQGLVPASRPPAVATTAAQLRLEGWLVAELPAAPPAERAALWAGLADEYDRTGKPADAAVSWLNAVWEHPEPPAAWGDRWRAAERTTPGRSPPAHAARLAAARLAGGDTGPELLGRLDAREAEVPVRAVWLARLTAARAVGGDPLGLARCRDRLLARLATGGPALDLDVPSFLRRGDRPAGGEPVGPWLHEFAGPARKWLGSCVAGTRLTWAGLDADRAATGWYGELVVAWGLAAVGDRSALDRLATATAGLLALRRPEPVPAVHRLLVGRIAARVRATLSGHPADPAADDPRLGLAERFAVGRLAAECESLGGGADRPPLDTPSARLTAVADSARRHHGSEALLDLLGSVEPATAAASAGPVFRAARALGLTAAAGRLVELLAARQPPPGGRRDLGLAVGRYAVGDTAGGDRALDAGRHRLLVAGVPDDRKRGELAVAYAVAVGHAAPALVPGRLDELVRRLGPVSAQGACGRFFALLPLRVLDAAVRAAVGDDHRPTPAARRLLAADELATRRRIARDIKAVTSSELRDPS